MVRSTKRRATTFPETETTVASSFAGSELWVGTLVLQLGRVTVCNPLQKADDSQIDDSMQKGSDTGVLKLHQFSIICALLLTSLEPSMAATSESVFLPPPRKLRMQLAKSEKLITDKQYSTAVSLLHEVLNPPPAEDTGQLHGADEDYFFEKNVQERTSLRAAARRLLAQLPEAGRELYELQYGANARRLLRDVIQLGDASELNQIIRRYPNTRASIEATMLLARHHLDHGQPRAAARYLTTLRHSQFAIQEIGPELSFMEAVCWRLAGMPSSAVKSLQSIAKSSTPITIAGQPFVVPTQEKAILPQLDKALGPRHPPRQRPIANWQLFRGNEARNAQRSGGRPLLHMRWAVPIANDWSDEQDLNEYRQQLSSAPIPSVHPLIVNGTVLMRSTQHLLAVDVETGKRIWAFPWDQTWNSSLEDREQRYSRNAQRLATRIWHDAAYGQLSSDGQSIFVLDNTQPQAVAPTRANAWLPMGRLAQIEPNQLVSLDLATEGKIRWVAGGVDGGEEPDLANVYFLGVPLPLNGHLYCLTELRGEIQLVVLSAETGRLEWSQQLAHVSPRSSFARTGNRRLLGLTPSSADGVLVCPTSAGAIVAIDLPTRDLMWGYSYAHRTPSRTSKLGVGIIQSSRGQTTDSWLDSSVTIADGHVVVTPVNSDRLHCIDLMTGKLAWKPKKRGKSLFVAAVHESNIMLVGEDQIEALRLSDGKPAWPSPVKFAPDGMPSGQGYRTGSKYYLPTTTPELLTIDLATGQIVGRAKTTTALGNLVCYRDQVFSQGADRLAAYYQTDRLRKIVDRRLVESADDAWARQHEGLLLLEDGKRTEAMHSLRQALALYSADDPRHETTKEVLVQTLLGSLRDNFSANGQLARELESLIEQPEQRAQFLRLVAEGYRELGDHDKSFHMYLKLAKLSHQRALTKLDQTPIDMEQVSRHLRVRRERWIQRQLTGVVQESTEQQRDQLEQFVEQQFSTADQSGSVETLREFLALYGGQSIADKARLLLATRLLEKSETLEAEVLLSRVARIAIPRLQAEALARLAKLLTTHSPQDAEKLYEQLASKWPQTVCLEGQTGADLLADWTRENEGQGGMRNWPFGKTNVSEKHSRSSTISRRQKVQGTVLHSLSVVPENWTISKSQTALSVLDNYGKNRFSLPLQSQFYRSRTSTVQGRAHGHVLLLTTENGLVAVDASPGKPSDQRILWRYQVRPLGSRQKLQRVTKWSTNVWGQELKSITDYRGRLQIGPITENGVCIGRMRELRCLSLISGELLWNRTDIPRSAEIFGDESGVIVISQHSAQGRVFDPVSGEELGVCTVPRRDRRWTTVGRFVLTWTDVNGDEPGRMIKLVDPIGDREIWSRRFTKSAKGCVTRNSEVTILEATGQLVMLNIIDGTEIIASNIEPMASLRNVYVMPSTDQFLVIASGPLKKNTKYTYRHYDGTRAAPMINGMIYAFDRQGKALWPSPARIENFGLRLQQPAEIPVLVFLRQVIPTQGNRQASASRWSSLLCVDKRDGRVLFEQDKMPVTALNFTLEASPEDHEVVLSLHNPTSYTFKFTSEPRPPEPPAQIGSTSSETTSSVEKAFKKMADVVFDMLEFGTKTLKQPQHKNARIPQKNNPPEVPP